MITHCFQCKARLIDNKTCPNGCEQNPIIIQLNNKDKTIAELRQKLAVKEKLIKLMATYVPEWEFIKLEAKAEQEV